MVMLISKGFCFPQKKSLQTITTRMNIIEIFEKTNTNMTYNIQGGLKFVIRNCHVKDIFMSMVSQNHTHSVPQKSDY